MIATPEPPTARSAEHCQLALPCGHDLALPTDATTPYLSGLILAHQSQCEATEHPGLASSGDPRSPRPPEGVVP